MGLTKTEINLRRLLSSMPEQNNHAKLAQYIVTLKEQLALLTGESGQGSLPCISEEKAKEYAEQIEAAALKINTSELDMWDILASKDGPMGSVESSVDNLVGDLPQDSVTTAGLRKRITSINTSKNKGSTASDGNHGQTSKATNDRGSTLKVDSATLGLIEKHRHLQEDLTDEMVDLARQMKEASLSMNAAVLQSKNVLDSTERAVEHSLAATNQSNKRAHNIFSQSFKTGCLTWLIILAMCCMFLLMVFLIRIT